MTLSFINTVGDSAVIISIGSNKRVRVRAARGAGSARAARRARRRRDLNDCGGRLYYSSVQQNSALFHL